MNGCGIQIFVSTAKVVFCWGVPFFLALAVVAFCIPPSTSCGFIKLINFAVSKKKT
jgi:hypothetical protein